MSKQLTALKDLLYNYTNERRSRARVRTIKKAVKTLAVPEEDVREVYRMMGYIDAHGRWFENEHMIEAGFDADPVRGVS